MFKYFTIEEFDCQETGENGIKEEFVAALDTLRDKCGFSFRITSGYRSPRHSREVKKPNGPGQHGKGVPLILLFLTVASVTLSWQMLLS
tara:strand:+ start:379 stop:645 length:267 start_codon:yes stop_codon:yes gene_type:complete